MLLIALNQSLNEPLTQRTNWLSVRTADNAESRLEGRSGRIAFLSICKSYSGSSDFRPGNSIPKVPTCTKGLHASIV